MIADPWAIASGLLNPPERRWLSDPSAWAAERLGAELWSKQREIIQSVRDHSQTAVHSCHEVGKSYTAALTVCWWLDVHPPGTAFVVTSAPTDKQVKAILWREINRMHAKAGLGGRTNLSEWYMGKELVAFGRKPADHDPTAFQGLHARHMLLVWDEACGIPKAMWDAGSSLVANKHGRTLAIGNPDDPMSEFASKCKSEDWNVIHIGYKHSPNFTDEKVSEELSDLLIHPEWVEMKRREWGSDSALFKSKCEGEFPEDTADGVIPLWMLNQCRYLEFPNGSVVEAGIDVGAGSDRTVIRERRGMRAGREHVFVEKDLMKAAGILVEKINEWGVTRVKIDSGGVGQGLADRLAELSSQHNHMGGTTHHAEILYVNFGESSVYPDRFANIRAELYWENGRENSRKKLWDLTEVDDDVFAELIASGYEILDSKSKIKIEKKDKVIERLGRSPDRAEALLLAFYGAGWYASFPGAGQNQSLGVGR